MQTDPDKPKNYIGLTKSIATSYQESFVGKMVFDGVQKHISESTVDFTFVIEGTQNDELPERALSTLRIVHVNRVKVAKDPRPYLAIVNKTNRKRRNLQRQQSTFSPQVLLKYSLVSMQSMINLTPLARGTENDHNLQVIAEEDDDEFEETPKHLRGNVIDMDYFEQAIDVVIDILRSVGVPCRHKPGHFDPTSLTRWKEEIEETGILVMSKVPALRMFDRSDIGRYILHFDYDLKITAKRLVETAAWRGKTFPIDKRICRIELQNGQFFQQGFDNDNNPVFYFRNLCRGPWRGHIDATIMAILYRLDKSLDELRKINPHIRVTLVVLMGHAKRGARRKINGGSSIAESTNGVEEDFVLDEDQSAGESAPFILEIPSEDEIKVKSGNPRISTDEQWTCHTNVLLIKKLLPQLSCHYPDRLSKVLVLKGRGKNHYYREKIQGNMMVRKWFRDAGIDNYQQLRNKIRFVTKTSELTQYIPLKDLPTFVGGIAPIQQSAYEF